MDIVEHLKSRGMDVGLYRDVPVSVSRNTATFYLWNLSGQLVGCQMYNPAGDKNCRNNPVNSKYFNRMTHQEDAIAVGVWGLQYFDISEWDFLFLTEGVFDAVKVLNAGFPCVALLGATVSVSTSGWLASLPHKKVALLDGDVAGRVMKHLSTVYFNLSDPFKDLGEMPQEDADDFLRRVVESEHLVRRPHWRSQENVNVSLETR